jgi:hypothetical protein
MQKECIFTAPKPACGILKTLINNNLAAYFPNLLFLKRFIRGAGAPGEIHPALVKTFLSGGNQFVRICVIVKEN